MKQASTNTVRPITAGSRWAAAAPCVASILVLSASACASSASECARSDRVVADCTSSCGVIGNLLRGGDQGGHGQGGGAAELRVHHGTTGGQQGRLDDLVGAIELELLGLLVDQRRQEGEQVGGIEAVGVGGDRARHCGRGA